MSLSPRKLWKSKYQLKLETDKYAEISPLPQLYFLTRVQPKLEINLLLTILMIIDVSLSLDTEIIQ